MKIVNQILFQPTFACNLRCRYCYLGKKRKKPSEENFSSVITSAKLLKEKISAADYEINNVLFHGGETTMLPPELLAATCNELIPILTKDKGHFTIQTNGTRLTSEYVHDVEQNIDPNARLRFSISLDGPREITDHNRGRGTYDKVLENAEYLKNKGYCVVLFGVFTAEMMTMLDDIGGWIQWLNNKNYSWKFQLASAPGNLNDEQQIILAHWLHKRGWHRLYNSLSGNVCAWKGNDCHVLHFNADGQFPPCDRSIVTTSSILNWMKVEFEDAIRTREQAFKDFPVAKKCTYCPIRPICNSGCPVFRVDGVSHECMLRKTIYQLEARRLGIPVRKTLGLYRGDMHCYANHRDIPSVEELTNAV